MGKMFYSYDDGQLYMLHRHCTLDTLMDEQKTENGVLIRYAEEVFETVEYIGGKPVEFDTRVIDGDAVIRSKHVFDKPNKPAVKFGMDAVDIMLDAMAMAVKSC